MFMAILRDDDERSMINKAYILLGCLIPFAGVCFEERVCHVQTLIG